MKDELVCIDLANIAKEKGFNIEVFASFNKGKLKPNALNNGYDFNNDKAFVGRISAPTQSLLQKWLRETHNIDVFATPYKTHYLKTYKSSVYTTKGWEFETNPFLTYEEALEEGLIQALKYIK